MLNRKCLNTWIRLFAITVLISCSSKNLKISKKGDLDDAIKIAITDYAIWAKKKYNNQPITFYVDIDQENQYVYSFSIGPSPTTSYYNEKYLTDLDIEKMPTNYFIVNDQLYYWFKGEEKGDIKNLEVFKKYGLLVEDDEAFTMYLESTINDKQKTTYYYFCKNNLNKKIKVRSSNSEDFSKLRRKFSCK